jgi:hypothetical protein
VPAPKKPNPQRRDRRAFVIEEPQWRRAMRRAKQLGINTSEYIRRLIDADTLGDEGALRSLHARLGGGR